MINNGPFLCIELSHDGHYSSLTRKPLITRMREEAKQTRK